MERNLVTTKLCTSLFPVMFMQSVPANSIHLDEQEASHVNPSTDSMFDFSEKPIRHILAMLGVKWWQSLIISIVFLLKHSPVVMYPLFVEYTLEVLTEREGTFWEYMLWPSLGLVALQLANIPSHVLFVQLASKHLRGFEKNIRSVLIRHLQFLSMGFHNNKPQGELQAKVLRDVEQLELLVRTIFFQIPVIAFTFLFAFGVTWSREPKVLLFFALVIPFALGIARGFRSILNSRNKAFRQDMEGMSSVVSEMINMIPISKAHGLEEFEIDRVQHHLNHIEQSGRKLDRSNAFFESSSFITFQVTQLICLAMTATMCSQGMISLPEVILYQTLFAFLIQSINQVLGMVPQLAKGMESMRSLGEVLSTRTIESHHGKAKLPRLAGRVDFDQVSFSYDDEEQLAIKDLSFTIWPGECVAFVGESGSGKSTIMNLIIGFYHPQKGSISIDQHDLEKLDLQSWRKDIAVVPQNVLLFSGSIRENICYGISDVDEDKIENVVAAAQLRDLVDKLPNGLNTTIGGNGLKLSGGQRQRLAIARALIRDPKVIILDEATSALDVISEREVQLAIDEMVKGRTTFIVAHRLSTIRQADRVFVMKDGQLQESGEPEALLQQKGEFAKLKALQ